MNTLPSMELCATINRRGESKTYRSAKDFLSSRAGQLSWESPGGGLAFHRFFLNENADDFYTYGSHMLALPLLGSGRIEWKSNQAAGQQPIRLQQVTIEPARTFWHRCSWKEMVCLTLHIDPHCLAKAVHEDFDPDLVELKGSVNAEDPLLTYLINVMHFELEMPNSDPLYIETLFSRVSAHLLEKHTTRIGRLKRYQTGLSSWRLNAVREYIENHLAERLTLAQLANAAGDMSLFHFARLFAKSIGKTPHQFIMDRRLRAARDMLQTNEGSIAEAACASGFSDQSHLTHAFKNRFGITPAQLSHKRARFHNTPA